MRLMFTRIRKIVGSAALTLGLMSLAAVPAGGTVPGENGRSAFMRQDDAARIMAATCDAGPPSPPTPSSTRI